MEHTAHRALAVHIVAVVAGDVYKRQVFGLLSTMYAGCLPLGMAIFGPLADVVSLRWIMAGAGGAILAAAAAVGTDHRMRAV